MKKSEIQELIEACYEELQDIIRRKVTGRKVLGGSFRRVSHSTIAGGGCRKFVPVLGRDGTKIVPTEDMFDQPPGEMSSIQGKLVYHVGDHVVQSSEADVLVTSPGTESPYSSSPIVERLGCSTGLTVETCSQLAVFVIQSIG